LALGVKIEKLGSVEKIVELGMISADKRNALRGCMGKTRMSTFTISGEGVGGDKDVRPVVWPPVLWHARKG
jgi:hypothetical protein